MLPPERLHLPRRPAEPQPVQFPVIASLAPLAAAGLIWAITGSAFALVFGVLGPVIAVATLLDNRRVSRRMSRRESVAWLQARGNLRAAVVERHSLIRRAAWQRTPAASTIIAGGAQDARWRPERDAVVTLGTGTMPSDVTIGGEPADEDDAELCAWAASVGEAPVAADIHGGLGLTGPVALTRAVARSVLVQLAHARSPAATAIITPVPGDAWHWVAALPHAVTDVARPCTIALTESSSASVSRTAVVDGTSSPGGARLLVAIGDSPDQLPPGCATVIRVIGVAHAEVLRSPTHPVGFRFRPELVSEAQAAGIAAVLAMAASRAGVAGTHRAVPEAVTLAEILPPDRLPSQGVTGSVPRSLVCPVGAGAHGTVSIDLVESGPHAIVGGTTGSGKSELLATWVASLAWAYSPAEVTFLLVDFKGGAAFTPLRVLPHCVGVITDLDEREASRALASLRAELRYREEVLRDAGARDVSDAAVGGVLPRLVIVVDEFQAMLDAFPQLHELFVSLAARGRSLGIHLILCTQRPAGVVRDSLLANCSLRVSLRVNNRADSQAVIGTDAAAAIPGTQPGRCLVQTREGTLACQVATTTSADLARLAGHSFTGPAPRRPWMDPLPVMVTEDAVRHRSPGTPAGQLMGLVDEPEHQRYRVASYDPWRDGNLLIIGGAGSGKSSLLDRLAGSGASEARVIAADVEATWDAIAHARTHAETGAGSGSPEDPIAGSGGSPLILLDDLDAVLGRWDPEYQLAALEALTGLLRDHAESSVRLVVAMQRLVGPLRNLAGLFPDTVLLRLENREDYRAAGGADALFDPELPPGGGLWRGSRIQLVHRDRPMTRRTSLSGTPVIAAGRGTLLVVSGAPARMGSRLRTAVGASAGPTTPVVDISRRAGSFGDPAGGLAVGGPTPGTVFIGSPDDWQHQWSLLAALRPAATMVFDRCSIAEFRQISGTRQLPPPLAPGRNHLWRLSPEGDVDRAALPHAEPLTLPS